MNPNLWYEMTFKTVIKNGIIDHKTVEIQSKNEEISRRPHPVREFFVNGVVRLPHFLIASFVPRPPMHDASRRCTLPSRRRLKAMRMHRWWGCGGDRARSVPSWCLTAARSDSWPATWFEAGSEYLPWDAPLGVRASRAIFSFTSLSCATDFLAVPGSARMSPIKTHAQVPLPASVQCCWRCWNLVRSTHCIINDRKVPLLEFDILHNTRPGIPTDKAKDTRF